jgi:hypothetical protein
VSPAQTESKLSSLGLKILSLLEDGEWHPQEDIIDGAMYLIPPGEAFRHGQQKSRSLADRRSQDDIIHSGRRSKTVAMLNNMAQNRRIEREDRDGEKWVRVQRPVANIYVLRDENDNLQVVFQKDPGFVVHVIDAWARSTDPEGDAERVKQVFETLPYRMEGKEEVQKVCRALINRLNVEAAMRRFYEPKNDDTSHQQGADT